MEENQGEKPSPTVSSELVLKSIPFMSLNNSSLVPQA